MSTIGQHQPYPLQLKTTPSDIIKYNGHAWVAIAISIQNGEEVMLARMDGYGFKYEAVKPTIDNCEYGAMHTDISYADWIRIVNTDHGTVTNYF